MGRRWFTRGLSCCVLVCLISLSASAAPGWGADSWGLASFWEWLGGWWQAPGGVDEGPAHSPGKSELGGHIEPCGRPTDSAISAPGGGDEAGPGLNFWRTKEGSAFDPWGRPASPATSPGPGGGEEADVGNPWG